MSRVIRGFRDLDVWQAGMTVVELTYKLSAGFPAAERFGLTSQMRRACVSVPSNVAEGQALRLPRWGLRHIAIASGSLAELDTQLEVALRLGFVQPDTARDLQLAITRVRQLLYGLRRERERRVQLSVVTLVVAILSLLALTRPFA